MPLYFKELHGVHAGESKQPLPQIGVEHGFLIGFLPTTLFPRIEPVFIERIYDVSRIAENFHGARVFQLRKPHDHRHEFHAVVRRARFAA